MPDETAEAVPKMLKSDTVETDVQSSLQRFCDNQFGHVWMYVVVLRCSDGALHSSLAALCVAFKLELINNGPSSIPKT